MLQKDILTKEYYEEIHREYGCFPQSAAALTEAVCRLTPAEGERVLALARKLEAMERWEEDIQLPTEPDMVSALAVAANVPVLLQQLQDTGFSRETAVKTVQEIDDGIMESARTAEGKPGLSLFLVKWFFKYLRGDIIRIGRFNFERTREFAGRIRVYRNAAGETVTFACDIALNCEGGAAQKGEEEAFFADFVEDETTVRGHKVTDGRAERDMTVLEKAQWKQVLAFGDPVIHMHIPGAESFAPDYVARSYEEGLATLRRCWPEFRPRALVCKSWLMDPVLQELLPETSNIVAFQRPYTNFPARGNATSALQHVFGCVPEGDFDALPENTSLQRSLKAHYMAGKCVRFAFSYWLLEK